MSRVLLIGLDGATFDVIRPLSDQGRLPNLSRLMAEGAWGVLKSTIPPITPTAWTTVFTGKNPGKHGIYDFQSLDPETYERRPVRVDAHREKSLWQLLGDAGKRSIILDVPYTYPPRPLNGLMITGYGTPRTSSTIPYFPPDLPRHVPEELRPEVKVALPQHRFDRSQGLVTEWHDIMLGRARLLQHMMDDEEWDFFFVVFNITDNLAHVFWTFADPGHPNFHRAEAPSFREALFSAYEQCDHLIGQLMSSAGPEATTLVMSDHGFGSIYPRQYLFQQLAQAGYLRYRSATHWSAASDGLMKLALRAYGGLPFLREWLKGLRPAKKQAITRALDRGGLLPEPDAIDSKRSLVLPTSFGLQLWINNRERFAGGHEEKGDTLLDELLQLLPSRLDPSTGLSVIREVHRGTDLFHGPMAPHAPDLVIEYRNFFAEGVHKAKLNPRLEGGHTAEGILLAQGPSIQPGIIRTAELADLAPTILHLSGLAVPPDMDGRVLSEMFLDEFKREHPVVVGESRAQYAGDPFPSSMAYSPEEEKDIEELLRQLGYI